jgi:hypothetical protein
MTVDDGRTSAARVTGRTDPFSATKVDRSRCWRVGDAHRYPRAIVISDVGVYYHVDVRTVSLRRPGSGLRSVGIN